MGHFPCRQVSVQVVEAAAGNGRLNVLEFLLALDDAPSEPCHKKRKVQQFSPARDAGLQVCWGGRSVEVAFSNRQYETVQWLCERGLHTPDDEKTAKRTVRALRLGDRDLVEFLLHGGGLDLDSSAFLTPQRVDAILEFAADPDCAVHAFPAVIELRSASLMQKLVQLHSPLPKDHVAWLYVWKIALTGSCRRRDLSSFRWQMEHWLGREACSDLLEEFDFASFMAAASGGGHVEVMEYIHHLKLLDGLKGSVMLPAIYNGHLDAVKWLFSHGWRAERNVPFAIMLQLVGGATWTY